MITKKHEANRGEPHTKSLGNELFKTRTKERLREVKKL
jgi:hypothetical protein